jgi:hypothetical protein
MYAQVVNPLGTDMRTFHSLLQSSISTSFQSVLRAFPGLVIWQRAQTERPVKNTVVETRTAPCTLPHSGSDVAQAPKW